MVVLLNRVDRPRYYTFYCVHCGKPLAELTNGEPIAIGDIVDMSDVNTIGVGVRCLSRFCRDVWYYFNIKIG